MHNNPERTTAMGMIRYAHEFMEAGLAVDEKMGSQPGYEIVAPIPALYLLGHSIELTLKAYLLSQGVSHRKVRALSHDLHACMRKAKEHGLLNHAQLSSPQEGALELLNTLYSTKQLEYIVTGVKQFPLFGLVELLSARLFNAVASVVGFSKRFEGYSGI